MTAVFAFLFIGSFFFDVFMPNRLFYLFALIYSVIVTVLFLWVLRKDSVVAQLIIYLSISLLFFFGGLITQNKPDLPATTFIALLLISPMFMMDKPYFMAIELTAASVIFLIWMHGVKTPEAWKLDCGNVIVFAIVGIFIHMISNSLRIKEFVLSREIRIQKDLDELTGLKNKGCVTREINEFLADDSRVKGLLFILDINHFKSVNDTYGHDVGDDVIHQLGVFLNGFFTGNEIVGRFGGDEFIVFLKDTDETAVAEETAQKVIEGVTRNVVLPNRAHEVSVSIGIAVYRGLEKNYSEVFKKADVALYQTKADRSVKYAVYEETEALNG